MQSVKLIGDQMEQEQKESREPAHHQRRPMNAFLIFCKRHRGTVRLHFPHFENRAVTRVLGEWWATLHQDQREPYKTLAQEYKDAFFSANPDFKWYKLPAPPLRTLTTRPTNKKQESGSSYDGSELSNENYEPSDCPQTITRSNEAIQPGKLADESQIGGLSSLFTPQKNIQIKEKSSDIVKEPLINSSDRIIPKPPKKRYTELPAVDLEQKRDCKVHLFDEPKIDSAESNNNEQHHLNEEEEKHDAHYSDHGMALEENNYRGERSCKGLRYQKFLAEQLRTAGPANQQIKRKRIAGLPMVEKHSKERRNSISSNVSEKTDSLSSEGGHSIRSDLEHLVDSAESRVEASKPEDTETEEAESNQDYTWTSGKRFKAEDFNLEKKIEALPSLSLEEFQEKKKQQRTKKKKIPQKLNTNAPHKRSHQNQKNPGQSNNQNNRKNMNDSIDPNDEAEKALLVGSQKRKARKQSITRNASADASSSKQNQDETNQPWCASPDLEALACLAEIAANRTKLTK